MYNPYETSLETQILSATPVELTAMLYDGALTAVREARRHLAEGRIPERGRQISKAVEILAELSRSLDLKQGGDLTVRLASLYDYMQRTLLDANFRQADDGMATTENLLKTLSEAWSQVAREGTAVTLSVVPRRTEYSPVRQQWSA